MLAYFEPFDICQSIPDKTVKKNSKYSKPSVIHKSKVGNENIEQNYKHYFFKDIDYYFDKLCLSMFLDKLLYYRVKMYRLRYRIKVERC